ncbi:adenylyl-sulfate kinase [bacterium]|nr:adenylyl-sulfate kinase [bacterium]|tara:strand:- start:55437 stop:57038 length:1602 start_codon:yes stop_codon:yes gene_type:complete
MKTKIIVTLGPSTRTEKALRNIKAYGVDFVRVNMSHSSIKDLRYFIRLSKKVGIPFIVDTEGSQIRTGELSQDTVRLKMGEKIKIYAKKVTGNKNRIYLTPPSIVPQLEEGDVVHPDFDAVELRVIDISCIKKGYVVASVEKSGSLGRNKGVVVDSVSGKRYVLPPLSSKDHESIKLGLENNIKYIAASFMRGAESVEEVRKATRGKMKIISKVECIDGLNNLDGIIKKSDIILLDRGDLSKEVALEKIPFIQKLVINSARVQNKDVIVATNLLESMIESRRPTIAEVHDVVHTIFDGAYGLALSAETAIGKNPIECVSIMRRIIDYTDNVVEKNRNKKILHPKFISSLEQDNYLEKIKGVVLWFTGLSGSGKTTLGNALQKQLEFLNKKVIVLDGDYVRKTINRHLDFSRKGIRENNRIIAELAREKSGFNDIVLVSAISPYQKDRATAREIIGENFLEIFIDCPLSVCEKRDAKGLYKKARAGEIENFIGLSELNLYERPSNPDIAVRTDRTDKKKSVTMILSELALRGHI